LGSKLDEVIYYSGGTEMQLGNSNNYNLLEIKYYQYVDTLPVTIAGQNLNSAKIILGQKNQVVKAIISPQIVKLNDKYSTTKPYNQDKLKSIVRQGEILYINSYTDPVVDISQIKDIVINRVDLIYVFKQKQGLLIPSFSVNATAKLNKNNSSTDIRFILPATNI
jgi:hypothetical protein